MMLIPVVSRRNGKTCTPPGCRLAKPRVCPLMGTTHGGTSVHLVEVLPWSWMLPKRHLYEMRSPHDR